MYHFSDNSSHTIDKGSESGEVAVIFSATFDITTFSARGGTATVQPPASPYMTWKGTQVNKTITLSGLKLVSSGTVPGKFSINTLTVTAKNRGSIEGGWLSCQVYLQATTTIDGETVIVRSTNTVTISQSQNILYLSSGSINVTPSSFSLAGGESATAQINYTTPFVFAYSSGETERIYSLSDLTIYYIS
ncbi:MAG: hypothetical protein LUE98_11350 [Tannerellaceae bacterium]|nr:hypothetical protein [Tannerellaceae bacterium]